METRLTRRPGEPGTKKLFARFGERLLRVRCTLAIYDVLAGPSGAVLFPVPWARTPDTSFLVQPNELRRLLEDAGFTISDWLDTTEAARAWFVSLAEKIR